MFISHTYQLIFLEVPRTASRSISEALTRLDPESPTVAARRAEGSAADYHGFRNELLADPDYRVVATHRNPYERVWSFWKHRNNTGNPPVFKNIDWPTYVDWVCDPSAVPQISKARHDVPVAEMFDLDRVDFWLDFGKLKQSWKELGRWLELDLPGLKTLNASPDRGYLSGAYDTFMAGRIWQRFARDFEFFGYDRDSWKVRDNRPEPERPVDSPQGGKSSVRPRVAILTTFAKRTTAFSLQRVVQDQIAMFVRHGYEPLVLVIASEYWAEPEEYFADPHVTIVQYPALKWISPEEDDQGFLSDIGTLREALRGPLSEVDVVITHDLIYLPLYLKLSVACRQLARELPALKWLHWIHSATGPQFMKKEGMASILYDDVMSQKWPGSHPVYFNRMSIPRIARNFMYEDSDVRIVPHPTNICEFLGLGPLATRLYDEKRLYQADYISIVPVRLDRGKQVEWIIKIHACLKALAENVRVVVMDFHSQSEEKRAYRDELKAIAHEWGLVGEELTFMSEFDESIKNEAPHGLVRELFSVSNLFIQPSRSESYSLTAQEAAICGNLLVLNDDFPPFREMYGEQALYFQFSSNIDRIRLQDGDTQLEIQPLELDYLPPDFPGSQVVQEDDGWRVSGEAAHANVIAQRIRYEFTNNIVLRQRQRRLRDRNLFHVFNRHLEPLIRSVCGS